MKLKLAALLALSIILTACGKSEEEKKKEEAEKAVAKGQAQLAAMQIENTQRSAVMEALNFLATFKTDLAEVYATKGKCANYSDDKIKSEFIGVFFIKDDCTLNATFRESSFTPDLSKQTITLKMIPNNKNFEWQCSFSGVNKKDIPSSCK